MLAYFVYYCVIGAVFWLVSFARRPLTRIPIAEAWRSTTTLGPITLPPIVLVATICVALLLTWPFFAVQAIWKS